MNEFWESLDGLGKFYFLCAVAGGVFFVMRLVLMMIGGIGGEGDMDVDVDGDVDIDGMDVDGADADIGDHDIDHGHDTDLSFKLLSIQGLTAFFLMFGLVGLAVLTQTPMKEHAWGKMMSLGWAAAAGGVTIWIMKGLFSAMGKLQASGNVRWKNAVGAQGTVYLTIPETGTGQVQVTVQNRLRTVSAKSGQGQRIETGTAVKVVRVTEGNVMVVEKV